MTRDLPALAAAVAVLVASTLLAHLLGERIPLNEGFGFEAHTIYRPIVEALPQHLRERSIDAYSIQRVLPFLIAHLTLRTLGQPLDGPRILLFFDSWNILALACVAVLWLRLSGHLALSRAGRWLGLLGLLGSFAALKLTSYYPVNIDTSALLLGTAMLSFWVRRRPLPLLVASLAGLVVWPSTVAVGSLLLLLPAGTRLPPRVGPLTYGPALLAIAVAVLWGVFGFTYLRGYDVPTGVAEPVRALLPLSFLTAAAWVVAGLAPLTREDVSLPVVGVWPRPSAFQLATVATLVGAWFLLTRVVAAPGPPRLSASEFLFGYFTFGATSRPGQFAVAHVTYFGPIVLLAFLLWPAVCRHARILGAGAVGIIAFTVAFGVNGESRQLINLLPFVVLPTVLAAEGVGASQRLLPWAFAIAVVLSKIWLPINYAVADLGRAGRFFPLRAGSFQDFPAQAWFLNFGPWMSNEMFLVQAIVTGLMAWTLWRSIRAPSV